MFRFYFCFYFWNATFITKQLLSFYTSITSHVNISSNLFSKKHHVRLGTFTSYFTAICLWFKFNTVPILVLPFQFLQHCHECFLDKLHFNWIIHVINSAYLHQLVLSSPNCWYLMRFNLWPLCFIKPDQYPFHIVSFLFSSVTPQYLCLNEFNLT